MVCFHIHSYYVFCRWCLRRGFSAPDDERGEWMRAANPMYMQFCLPRHLSSPCTVQQGSWDEHILPILTRVERFGPTCNHTVRPYVCSPTDSTVWLSLCPAPLHPAPLPLGHPLADPPAHTPAYNPPPYSAEKFAHRRLLELLGPKRSRSHGSESEGGCEGESGCYRIPARDGNC